MIYFTVYIYCISILFYFSRCEFCWLYLFDVCDLLYFILSRLFDRSSSLLVCLKTVKYNFLYHLLWLVSQLRKSYSRSTFGNMVNTWHKTLYKHPCQSTSSMDVLWMSQRFHSFSFNSLQTVQQILNTWCVSLDVGKMKVGEVFGIRWHLFDFCRYHYDVFHQNGSYLRKWLILIEQM